MRPKILHVIDHTEEGGAQVVVRQLIENLGKEFAFSVAVLGRPGRFSEVYQRLGVRVFEIGHGRSRWNLSSIIELVQIIRTGGYDLVHTHLLKSSILGTMAARCASRKVLLHDHSSVSPELMKLCFRSLPLRYIYLLLYRLALQFCHQAIVLTPAAKTFSHRHFFIDLNKIIVVPNGVDCRQVSDLKEDVGGSIRAALGLTPETRVVVMVGRLEPEKDWMTFLKVARYVPKLTDVNCAFLVIGVGSQERHLRTFTVENKLNQVYFLGYQEDIFRLLSGADVFLLTSNFEPFGIVVLEAMLIGCPIVATRSGGPDSILTHEFNGLLAEVGDFEALAKDVVRLIQDHQLRRDLVQNARKTVAQFYTTENFSTCMADAYKEVLQQRAMIGPSRNITS